MYAGPVIWVSNYKHWRGSGWSVPCVSIQLTLSQTLTVKDLFDALSRHVSRLCSRWHCRRHRATGRAIRVRKRVPPTFIVDAVIVAVGVQRPDLSASF